MKSSSAEMETQEIPSSIINKRSVISVPNRMSLTPINSEVTFDTKVASQEQGSVSNKGNERCKNGDESDAPKFVTETSCYVNSTENATDGYAVRPKEAIRPKDSGNSEENEGSFSPSPDSGAVGDHSSNSSHTGSFGEDSSSNSCDSDDRNSEVVSTGSSSEGNRHKKLYRSSGNNMRLQVQSPPDNPKEVGIPIESIVPLKESSYFEKHEDMLNPQEIKTSQAKTVPHDEVTDRSPQIKRSLTNSYMRQISGNSSVYGGGKDNLAFIAEEELETGDLEHSVISERTNNESEKGCSNCYSLPNVPAQGKVMSLQDECILDNLQRNNMRDVRKLLKSHAFGHPDGIRVDHFIDAFGKKDLLAKLFHLFDYKQQDELNQEEWIEFLKSRLDREERQVDFVEVVESVAYAVCGEENVKFDKFCVIFRTKNVLNKFFRLIDKDLDGTVTADQVMEFISALSSARQSNRLTKESIKWLEQLFRQYVGPGNEIRKEDFKKIIQTKNEFFTDRVFDIFDKDASGSISLHEFLDAMHQFAGQEPDDKLRFLFKIYDVDGDGSIQCEELGKVMRACMEENGMKFSDEQIHELTMALFEDADVEKRGALTFDALKAQLNKHEGLLENLSIRWLVPPKPKESEVSLLRQGIKKLQPHQFSLKYFKNNYVYLIWLLIFILTNVGLFIAKCFVYKNYNTYLMLARASGQCLNFNCTFIVIVMLRQCLTFLRARGASEFLPIDQHIYFHKMTGWFIFMFSVFHTVMHLINIEASFVPDIGEWEEGCTENKTCPVNSGNWTYWDFLFLPGPSSQVGILSLGLIPGFAFNSGVILMIILTLMVICSLPFVRRGGCFEVFYWTHLLYTVFWILLIIHAPNFWKWFIVPGIIFIIEQMLRYFNWRMGRGRTSVSSGILLPSKVTHLIIRRPQNFEFHPGDYVFVRIPQIAKYEWHPFTISSAPEHTDAIWLHIRAVGQWTTRLHEYFEGEHEKMNPIYDTRGRLDTVVSYSTVRTQETSRMAHRSEDELEEVELVVGAADRRNRLPTVGVPDSQETINPSSSASTGSESNQEFSSSMETISEQDAIIKRNKVPIRLKPKLTATKSLPNVHERMVKREVKLNLRNAPKNFHRSLSVNQAEETCEAVGGGDDEGSCSKPTNSSPPGLSLNPRANRVPRSLRYMRNKPTIISLKTPSYEGIDGTSGAMGNNNRQQQQQLLLHRQESVKVRSGEGLAEEGRANEESSDVFLETEGNDLHPIMGTTRTGQGSLAAGRPLEIYLDGPYGAPSSHIFRAEHAVLIATGIGVTPFASILQSIMLRYWATRVSCPKCKFTWCEELPQSVLNLKKVDFFWINRDQRSFEWFVHLLSQLEIEQAELGGAMERFLDMHMYITSALQKTDMKAVGLQLALDLLHEREKRDLITGLKTKTHAGRPNWSKVFQQLADQKKGKITVFYCGPPALARTIKYKCDEFGFSFRKELF